MTTAIALETSKGDFELGLALGLLLLFIAFSLNLILQLLTTKT
jgi:tungstate transport system permease protein